MKKSENTEETVKKINKDKNNKKEKPVKKEGAVSKGLNKILFKVCFILTAICILSFGGYFGFKKLSQIKTDKRMMIAQNQLEHCAELVTVKNNYSDIITIKKTRIAGLAKSFSIVRFTGVLRVGIKDISLSDIRVSNGGKTVEVVLPDCEILDNSIQNIEVFDEQRSIFVSVTLKEIVDEINASRFATEEKLIESGVVDDAKAQAVQIVTGMLKAAGFTTVKVN